MFQKNYCHEKTVFSSSFIFWIGVIYCFYEKNEILLKIDYCDEKEFFMLLNIDSSVEGLIFDLDGTLADTMPLHLISWMEASKKFNFYFSEKIFYELAGIPSAQIIEIINSRDNSNLIPEEISLYKRELFIKKLSDVKLIEPVAEIVYKYHGKLKMSIGTGGFSTVAELTMEKIGMDKYIYILVASDHVENHKPAPDTFLKCAELMGIAPEKCNVYEDGEQGLSAAKKAGMNPIDIRPYLGS